MSKGRFKDVDWNLADEKGNIGTWTKVNASILMDIRDELKTLNRLLSCPNFTAIPTVLRTIRRNTSGLRKPPKKQA